jgi:Flp pilus assembly pilin Flp
MAELIVRLQQRARELASREEGQGMVESALILVLISVAAITVLGLLGTQVSDVFDQVYTALGG